MEDIYYVESAKGELLDRLLARGYYRMGRFIFTTHTLDPLNDGSSFPVFWLRYLVHNVILPAKHKQLLKKNAHFKIAHRSFSITDELEQLYSAYAASLPFKAAPTLQDNLQDVLNEVYDTHIIEVRDGYKLIAAGIFDVGANSIAGIINVYDPQYKQQHSLGKYLMLLKYLYCLQHKVPYYYPGYYSTTYPVFDYKLFLDKKATEVFIPDHGMWIPYGAFAE
jgi:arginine-tRNA-protein transferase